MGISSSSFYYKKKTGKRGRKPSSLTKKITGEHVSNSSLVKSIEDLLSEEFVSYGYIKVTEYLKQNGYMINNKKVYRLMKENNLLFGNKIKPEPGRQFVKFRKAVADAPFKFLEMDIKYVHVKGLHRNFYLLTVLDIFSRKTPGYICRPSITQKDVVRLMDNILDKYDIIGAAIRNDNGSQFIANVTRQYLKSKGLYQEFTHIATPEENAHIESFHSIIQSELFSKYEFDTYEELQEILFRYYKFYNEKRIHSSIGYKSPDDYLVEWFQNNKELINCNA